MKRSAIPALRRLEMLGLASEPAGLRPQSIVGLRLLRLIDSFGGHLRARPTRAAPKLQQQVERLSQLPQAKQRVVMEMLEGFLNQAARSG